MAVDNGRYQVASPNERSSGAVDVCPYLHLARDSQTAAIYARTDHRCTRLGKDQISFSWQNRYCTTRSHTECPYYLGESATGAHKIRRGALRRGGRHALEMVGLLLLLLLLTLILLRLTTGFAPPVIGAFFDDSPDAAGRSATAQPGSDTLRAPLFHAFTQSAGPDDDAARPADTSDRLDAPGFAHDAFQALWMRTDEPVRGLSIERGWVWGPEPLTSGLEEEWIDSPDGTRLVQYFPKGRMENGAESIPSSGLLAIEMLQGRYQIGQDRYADGPEPPDIPIAGTDEIAGLPTYADIKRLGLLAPPGRSPGDLIDEEIVDDHIQQVERYGEWNVIVRETIDVTGHAVADVFADYLGARGTIHADGEYVSGPLFEPRYQLIGLPITEAYWATVDADGEARDVLWQCFERRCLTYDPAKKPGRRVESGDTGRHYYQWRYGELD